MHTIIQYEIMKYIKTYTFAVLTLMSIVLFLIGAFSTGKMIQKDIARYETETGGTLLHPAAGYPYRNIAFTGLAKPYSLLSFMADGGSSLYPKGYWIFPEKRIKPEYYPDSNFKLPYSPKIDWAFIVKIIFVLYIILLSHDSISGEKESGSLRLIFSNPVSRFSFLISKTASMLIIALLPLLIGMISGMLVLTYLVPSLNYGEILSGAMFFLILSLVLLAAFLFMSILFSSLILNSSISLLAILAVWLIMFIIPEISPSITRRILPFTGESYMFNDIRNAETRWFAAEREFLKSVESEKYRSEEDIIKAGRSLLSEQINYSIRQEKTYYEYLEKKQVVSNRIAQISLLGIYQNSVEKIANTGAAGQKYFLHEVNTFSNSYSLYVSQKVDGTIHYCDYNDQIYNILMYVPYQGKGISISWGKDSHEYTGDLSDFPKFLFAGPSQAQRFKSFLSALSGLLLWNLLLALGAFLAFNRADVR